MRKLLIILLLCSSAFGQFQQKPMLGEQVNWIHPLSKGLVGLWLLNEGSGNKVFDLSGNGNIGTLQADTHFVPGKFGSALDFDGTGDYVDVGSISSIPGAFSISLWAKRGTVVPANNVIVGWGGGGSNYAGLMVYENGNVIHSVDSGGTRGIWSGIWTDKSDFHHLVFVTDGIGENSAIRLYFDGVNKGDKSEEVSSFTAFRIAELIQLAARAFDGIIDHATIYNRALSASEIALLYREPFCMFEKDDIAMMEASIPPPAVGGQVILISMFPIFFVLVPAFFVLRAMRK